MPCALPVIHRITIKKDGTVTLAFILRKKEIFQKSMAVFRAPPDTSRFLAPFLERMQRLPIQT